MKSFYQFGCPFKIYLLGFFLALFNLATAQKTIIISDSLTVHAEKLEVNMGGLWMGKIRKFSFGEYAIVSSKGMGNTSGSSRSNLFGTKTESTASRKFSFVLSNKTSDSASVQAGSHQVMIQTLRKIALGNGWSVGNDELMESNNFTTLITANRDTTDTWALFMGTSQNGEANLTNGKRMVMVKFASSNKKIEQTSALNSVGYEFIENGKSLCALQYFSPSLKSTNIVWIHKNLDPKMKLVLASAMTSVLLVSSPTSPIN